MKKMLIMSLFGLFAAHESSAMFARAAKAGKGFIVGATMLATGVLPAVDDVYQRYFSSMQYLDKERDFTFQDDCDYTEEEAKKLYREYKNWASVYNKSHNWITENMREHSAYFGEPYPSDEYGIFEGYVNLLTRLLSHEDIESMSDFARECLPEEKNIIKTILQDAGVNASLVEQVLQSIYVSNRKHECVYDVQNDKIGISESCFSLNEESRLFILHEILGHFRHNIGHDRDLEYSQFLEEMRADIEAFKGLKRSGSSLNRPFLKNLDSLRKGYVANSQNFLNILNREYEREQLQEAEKLLEKIEKAERA